MPSPADQLFPIVMKPGILRDRFRYQGEYCTDGQWVRFYGGMPKKMGGIRAFNASSLAGVVNATPKYFDNISTGIYVLNINSTQIFFIGFLGAINTVIVGNCGAALAYSADPNTFTVTNYVSIGDKVPQVSPNNLVWQFIPFSLVADKQSYVLALSAQTSNNISLNTSNGSLVCYTQASIPLPFPIKNTNNTSILTGGILIVDNTRLYNYGENGIVQYSAPLILYSNSGKPPIFSLQITFKPENVVSCTGGKVIYVTQIRGGTTSPTLLAWTLTALCRITPSTITNSVAGGDLKLVSNVISNDCSIMSSRSVVEYEGFYYWMGTDGRFFLFNGTILPLENNINKQFVLENLDIAKRQLVYGVKNVANNEIRWAYPEKINASDPSIGCTRMVVYNIIENSWYDTAIKEDAAYYNNVTGALYAVGKGLTPVTVEDYKYIWKHEVNWDQVNPDNTPVPIDSYFTTPSMSWIAFNPTKQLVGIDRCFNLKRIEPVFARVDGQSNTIPTGNMTITVNTQRYPQSPVIKNVPKNSDGAPFTFNETTGRIDYSIEGGIVSFTFRSNVLNGNYYMGCNIITANLGSGKR